MRRTTRNRPTDTSDLSERNLPERDLSGEGLTEGKAAEMTNEILRIYDAGYKKSAARQGLTVTDEQVHIARKVHRCDACDEKIRPGEQYRRTVLMVKVEWKGEGTTSVIVQKTHHENGLTLPALKYGDSTIHRAEPTMLSAGLQNMSVLPGSPSAFTA